MFQKNKYFYFGVVVFLLIIATFIFLIVFFSKILNSSELIVVDKINLIGELKRVDTSEVAEVLKKVENLESLILGDVNNIKLQIEEVDWVSSVSVRKRWPDILNIYIEEFEPVAIFNENKLLTEKGELFFVQNVHDLNNMIKVQAPLGSQTKILKKTRRFLEILEYHNLTLVKIKLTKRYAWSLILTNNIEVQLGKEDVFNRLQRFALLYSKLESKEKNTLKYADARYDTGLAIGWIKN